MSGRTARARSRNTLTASSRASGSSGSSCSPLDAQSGSARDHDLQARARGDDRAERRGGSDDLLEVVDDEQQLPAFEVGDRVAARGRPRRRRARATARSCRRRDRGPCTAWSGTSTTPSANWSAVAEATACARRVFPIPPGPVIVSSRTSSRCRSAAASARLSLAPDEASSRARSVVPPMSSCRRSAIASANCGSLISASTSCTSTLDPSTSSRSAGEQRLVRLGRRRPLRRRRCPRAAPVGQRPRPRDRHDRAVARALRRRRRLRAASRRAHRRPPAAARHRQLRAGGPCSPRRLLLWSPLAPA